MSISLKALYDQVQNIKPGLTVIDHNYESINGHDKWFIKYSNGMIIQYGITPFIGEDYMNTPITFLTQFTNSNIVMLASQLIKGVNFSTVDNIAQVFRITTSSFNVHANHTGGVIGQMSYGWLAIGYLITNSIRSLLGGGLGWL